MEILLFGITKEIIGAGKLDIPADAGITDINGLKQWFAVQYPGLSSLRSLAVAVNRCYAKENQLLNSNDEIALIPPVSGG